MKDNKNDWLNGLVMPCVVAMVVSIIVCVIFLLIFAFWLTKSPMSDTAVLVMSLISQGVGVIVGAFFGAKIKGKNGLIVGAITGAILFILFTLIVIISGKALSVITLIRFAVLILSGVLGGVLGVNIKRKPKII